VPEAQLQDSGSGLAPATEGWFVVNVQEAEWWFADSRGAECWFESEYGDPQVEFDQLGIRLAVLEPGQSGIYHAESSQEAFLVLSGECMLLVEGEERLLRPWDFFHSPPWTEHAFAGAGNGPCVILMTGARGLATESEEWQVRYPVSELAAQYGACVDVETTDVEQAYANVEWFRRERPPYWDRLPWVAPQ
jgi:quercetin dioxygenase-like cupin family protein